MHSGSALLHPHGQASMENAPQRRTVVQGYLCADLDAPKTANEHRVVVRRLGGGCFGRDS